MTLPAGAATTQTWNAALTDTGGGRLTVSLPTWARIASGTYGATGFCGTGDPGGATAAMS